VTRAEELNERGRELAAQGRDEGAIAAYREAIAADPEWSVPWYNLGLVFKYRAEWPASAKCSTEAVLRDDADQGAWWNLGIAATALGDWGRARDAWRRCGVVLPEGTGPVAMNFGLCPIRLSARSRAEVVWCDRIDPARAIIRNVPLPESGHRFGDLLLHDGAPNGSRLRHGVEVPVFDALDCLERSDYRTYILDVPGSSESQRASIGDVAFELGMGAEDWSQSVSFLCKQCSEGLPHATHDTELRSHRPDLAVAAAARSQDELSRLVDEWRRRSGYGGYVGTQLVADGV
jgi:hypothetical protein